MGFSKIEATMSIEVLQEVLEQNGWADQGGFSGYKGNGEWAWVSSALTVTPEQMNSLFDLAGLEPKRIIPRGSCNTCQYSRDGRERGFENPCGPCKRPIMSNYRKRRG